MKIRRAKKEDLKQLARLFLNLHKFHSRFGKKYQLKPDTVCLKIIEKELRKYFRKPKTRTILIYKESNKILGFIDFHTEKREYTIQDKAIWIYRIYIDEGYRKRGIAKDLIKEVAKKAEKKGIKEIDLTYVPKNRISTNFWRSLGAKTDSVNAIIKVKNIYETKIF